MDHYILLDKMPQEDLKGIIKLIHGKIGKNSQIFRSKNNKKQIILYTSVVKEEKDNLSIIEQIAEKYSSYNIKHGLLTKQS
ncbi:MAG: hypothetical protein KKF48_00705 [Nanoarchaeota archaeon]|nr:hypothetical protein [Nanoarchaeota archaeon]MBU1027543.1 hypothetical protein [Nanoarchaeota archaeon]